MRSLTKDKDLSNVIPFPKNRIVEKKTTGPKKDQKFLDELHKQQTKEFVETSVDEISLNLLKRFILIYSCFITSKNIMIIILVGIIMI